MFTLSDQILVALISAMASIIATYLTVHYKDVVVKKFHNEPKDPMDVIFGGYEKLIAEQQQDIELLHAQLYQAQKEISEMKVQQLPELTKPEESSGSTS